MREYQQGVDADPEIGLELDLGNLGGLRRIVMVTTVALGFLAFIGILVMKTLEDVFESKAGAAWARAAQLDAQANIVDARTAQLGTLITGVLPIALAALVALVVMAMFVLVVWGMRRDKMDRQLQLLNYQQQSQLDIRPPKYYEPLQLRRSASLDQETLESIVATVRAMDGEK